MSAEANTPASGNPVTDHLGLWSSVYVKKATTGRGSKGKISPYGVQKLRELILELAVRGKLVLQDPNDEPASALLEKIVEEREQLLKKGKTKKQKKLPGVGDELPHYLPENWEWARLGEVTNYGITEKAEPGDVDGEAWVLELGDVEKTTSNLLKRVRYSECPFRSSKNRFNVGDVLYGKLRPYLDKVLVADEAGVCTTEIIPIRGYTGIAPSYLRLLLKAPNFIIYANESTHGMNLPRLGTEKARLALIPLAPTAEQHRIVAKVDELMALCDQLEQQQTHSLRVHQSMVETLLRTLVDASDAQSAQQVWDRIAEHFDTLFTTEDAINQLKQTILQLAIMGKLVLQDPNDKPASVLLETIVEEKVQLVKEGGIKKQKALPKIDEDEKLFELPMGWEWCRLQEIVYLLGDGLHGTPEYTPDERYFFINGNNLRGGQIVIKPETKTVTQDQYDKYRKKLGANTVLVSINGTLGNVAFYNNEEIVLGKSACYFNLAEDVYKQFVKVVIESPGFLDYAFKKATGSTIKNLGLKAMNSLPVALPPKDEQHRIVAKVDELMAICDALKSNVQDAQATQVQLADAVVRQTVA